MLQNNKAEILKVLEESKHLDRIGQVIKTRTFSSAVKNLRLLTSNSPNNREDPNRIKKYQPILKLAEDTFKTLPSLRHSSYQKYRQNSRNDIQNKTEQITTKALWRPETIIPSSEPFKVETYQRTQIIPAEKLFGTGLYKKATPKKRNFRNSENNEYFERVFERIKKRSEQRVIEYMSYIIEDRTF
ncbi:hypothetical protein SteCoe_7376 [Stentor coeruleus]|uniref:Uncharacterized protein n=1 Tax=Stentor coeruleus TaxID=5963 RepID=A0A1R2CMR2_9CILI|nr:hypothetical protein SteCoe_7376 [Stentor coeruleus]